MSNIPKFYSNKKYWMQLNRLVFGEDILCPGCKCALQENYLNRYLWCKACRKKYRPTSYRSSWLYGTKLSARQIFILIWCWQNRKSTETAMLLSQTSYPTVARWQDRFRKHIPDTTPLLEELVQVDESYFSKFKSKQPTKIVVGAIAPKSSTGSFGGKLALRITGTPGASNTGEGRGKDVLEKFIQDTVKPGSLVVTDKWYAYDELFLLGYEHESHNHSKGDYANTNGAERIWSIAKRHMRKLYGQRILTHQLEDLCIEWMARANAPALFTSPLAFLRFTLVPC